MNLTQADLKHLDPSRITMQSSRKRLPLLAPEIKKLSVFIERQLKSPNAQGKSWKAIAGYRKAWRKQTAKAVDIQMVVTGWPHAPEVPKLVTFTGHVGHEMDGDNLEAACKPARDSLKDAGIIQDDRPSAKHQFVYEQSVIPRKERATRPYGLTITVEIWKFDDRYTS